MARAAQKQERGFSYKKRDKDSLKERANMKGGNYDTYIKPKFKQWKPKDGKNIIRILPPTWADARHYGLDIYVNFNIGPDNQSYLSLSKHDRGPDPLAEARREAMNEGDKDFAKKLNPSQRILYWIIDRNDEDEGPLLWAAPFTFDKSLSNLCIDEDTKEVIFIDDPAKGRDVRFYREGQGLKTTYDPSKMKVLKESNIAEDEAIEQEWLDFIQENQLPDVLNFYDYEHIKASFGGAAGRNDDDEDDDKPRRKPIRDNEDDPGTKRTRRRSGEEADEDEPAPRSRRKPADEDDEPEEKPARRGRKAEVDADDEVQSARSRSRSQREPDTDDDDDEVKPASRRPRSRASDEDDEPAPKTRGPRRDQEIDDEDEPDEKPARGKRRAAAEDDDEDPPSTRRTKKSNDDDDEEGGGSLREKLAARRRSRNSDDD